MNEFISQYRSEIIQQTLEHLLLVGVSTAMAIIVGIPLGVLISRKPQFSKLVLSFANIMQTVPSLALFGFLIPLSGIGELTAIVALTLYALLPIIRNTYSAIANVSPAIREAGLAMGMTSWQLLWQVEIPLAAGVIISGIRVAAVIGIGLATISAAIGAGGLGEFIFRGLATVNSQLILLGAIPAAIMALMVDFTLGRVERLLTPTANRNKK
jgi:osmoprotectant transport system permease protein